MKYIRGWALPQPHCSGCGNGTIAQCFLRAVDQLKIEPEQMVAVSGIGCSSWIPSPLFKMDTLHTTHGRPIAFATGVKLARPELHVSVFTGDGDGIGIGGNHLIHASRRNIDLAVILVNNGIYGMTGGQMAPTTPTGMMTATTPYGNLERPFNIASLVAAAGATYVARWTTFHVRQLTASIKRAIEHKGFSFIEVISQCPVQFGKRIGVTDPSHMLRRYRDLSVTVERSKKMRAEELNGKIVIGEFIDEEGAVELTDQYSKLFKRFEDE